MPEARWLDRFQRPTAIRRLGTFHLHHAWLDDRPVVVAVSQGHVEPARAETVAAEASALQGVFAGRLGFPPVVAQGSTNDVVYLAFDFDARNDLWHLRAEAADRGEDLPAAGVVALLLDLVDVLAAAGPLLAPLRRLSPASVLFGPDGEVGLLALGAELLLHQGAGLPTAAAPARAEGVQATAHTLLALAALLLGHSPPRSAPATYEGLRAALRAIDPDAPPDASALAALARSLPGPSEAERISDRFLPERTLGFGRRGELFLARDTLLRQTVAIRWVTTRADAQALERLVREVRILRDVKHPHVVAGYDLINAGRRVGVVMEYVPGEPFDEALAAGVDRRLLLAALVEVAEALDHLASRRVVHREVKPANILLHPERGAVLVDLSCARPLDGPDAELSMDNQRFGAFRYMAPELHHSQPVPASDVYGLAMVAAELLCGEQALHNHPGKAVALAALQAAFVPDEAAEIIAAGLHLDPASRPSARTLGRALARLATSGTTLRAQADFSVIELGDVVIDLRRRVSARRVMRRLAEAHRQGGATVTLDELFAAGWPDVAGIRYEAKSNRVYNLVSNLRRLGLMEVIESDGGGYRLSASTRVVLGAGEPGESGGHAGPDDI